MRAATRNFGWLPDVPDVRDRMFQATSRQLAALPPRYDLRPLCPPAYDQEDLGSCTAQSTGFLHQFAKGRQKKRSLVPSRLFIYYNSRKRMGTIEVDSGAYLRDAMKTMAAEGACPETQWRYDITRFAERPQKRCYDAAKKNQVILYRRVPRSLDVMKARLVSKLPFCFGFAVYENFDATATTGILTMPTRRYRDLGGHAVVAVGFEDDFKIGRKRGAFIVRNSYGKKWGRDGYFMMPYDYVLHEDLSDDFWVLDLVE